MRHNTLYGMLQRGWRCITAFGRTPVCLNIPRMAQNRAGFEVAKEEEAEKMTGAERVGRGGGREERRGEGMEEGDRVAAAVKDTSWIRGGRQRTAIESRHNRFHLLRRHHPG